jgi:hypothetical protein
VSRQSTNILARDGEPKSRRPKSKSTTSFSRNTDLSKSKSTNRCVTFTGILRGGIARRHASDQSWLKISQKVSTTLEHRGLRNSRNHSSKFTRVSFLPDIGWSQRVKSKFALQFYRGVSRGFAKQVITDHPNALPGRRIDLRVGHLQRRLAETNDDLPELDET